MFLVTQMATANTTTDPDFLIDPDDAWYPSLWDLLLHFILISQIHWSDEQYAASKPRRTASHGYYCYFDWGCSSHGMTIDVSRVFDYRTAYVANTAFVEAWERVLLNPSRQDTCSTTNMSEFMRTGDLIFLSCFSLLTRYDSLQVSHNSIFSLLSICMLIRTHSLNCSSYCVTLIHLFEASRVLTIINKHVL